VPNNPCKLAADFAQDLEIVATSGTNFGSFPVATKGISDCLLNNIIEEALKINWTRDVFDRLLVAETMRDRSFLLITADQKICEKFTHALW
jgi:hypothetical protein